ncbi:unnamed protein product, partial [Vitis vinifera]
MKRSNSAINGVTGKECNPVSTKNPSEETICFKDDAEYVDPDPGHSFVAVKQQASSQNQSQFTPSWWRSLQFLTDGSLHFLAQHNPTDSLSTLELPMVL